jgi:hypothetical protein
MSGIDRVLAGILLVGAVGGTAAFARQSGSDASTPAVSLTAPPLQHIDAPGSVLFAHTPAPIRVVVDVRRRSSRPRLVAATPPPPPAVPPAVSSVAPATKQAAAVLPPPKPTRVLAAVALAPVQPASAAPATEAKAHGRALGHVKQHGQSATPVADTPVVDPAGAAQGNGSGHTNGRATPDGD